MKRDYKGIILAGGSGSRLFPISINLSKHLLSIYDKPLIYYPLSTLMLSKIRDIIIVVNKEHLNSYRKLLGDGSKYGIKIRFVIQDKPEGIPHALNLCKNLINKSDIFLILGDNILYGSELSTHLEKSLNFEKDCLIYSYSVNDPRRYGVLSKVKNSLKIIEKPKNPKSNKAIIGAYIFKNSVLDNIKKLKKSKRGEYEISDLINIFLKKNSVEIIDLNRGFTWIDAGTHESILLASNHIRNIEKIQSLKISCIEEISLKHKWINRIQLKKLIMNYPESDYKNYLKAI